MPHIVLLIHDDVVKVKTAAESLLNSLDDNYIVEWAESCADGVRTLRKDRKDRIAAVVVNLFLPDSQGLATFEKLFHTSLEVPILVLSSRADEGSAKLAVRGGAQDYFREDDLNGYLLPKAVHNMLEGPANVEALFKEKERAQVTLNSIGDAVVSTDHRGKRHFLQTYCPSNNWLASARSDRSTV